MQDSFEKRVQEKLDELRLTPSEPVWKNIEKELKPVKRRRFPFWIPFIIVLLGGAAWWLLQGSPKEAAPVAAGVTTPLGAEKATGKKASPQADRPKESKTAETKPAASSSAQAGATATDDTSHSHRKNAIGQQHAVPPSQTAGAERPEAIAFSNQIHRDAGKMEAEKASPDQEGREAKANNNRATDKTPSQPDVLPQASQINTVPAIQQPAVKEPVENALPSGDSTAKATEGKEILPLAKKDSVLLKTKVAAAKKGWQKMITVSGGWSRFSDGIPGSNQLQADFSASPSSGYNNAISGNPNPVKSGPAFQAGAGLSKAIHSRWNVAAGVHYAYYSTQTKVGTYKPIDTAVITTDGKVALEGYYSNANLRDFTMRYGFLEFPVSISFQPLAHLPLTLSAGASYGRLLHSTTLQYDRRANIYYAGKAAIRKNIFAGFASLQYAFRNRGAWQLEAGPVVQYPFSGLQRNSTKPRLVFAGLQSTLSF